MIPDLASVMRKRYRMEKNLRFAAAALFVVWIIYLGFGVVQAIGSLLGAFGRTGLGMFMALVASVPYLFGAVFLGVCSRRISNWILPIPKTGCPRCGYRLVALLEPRCPECGLSLPRELMHDPDQ